MKPSLNPSLLIRADASAQMGTGHVMRCLSLAQGWRRRGDLAVFSSAISTPSIDARIIREGFEFERLDTSAGTPDDAAKTMELAQKLSAKWIAADGYHFGADYQRAIKDAGLKLLLFDDYGHAKNYCADLVLNQNLGADEKIYANRSPQTRLLLGAKYVLLREQFNAWGNWKREIPAIAKRILVTLGGADPGNVTAKVIEGLRGLDIEARIVVGGSNPHLEELKSQIESTGFDLMVDAPDMPELMAWADMAIAAGGTTSWELAYMGLPCLMIVLADNQRAVAASLESAGVVRVTTTKSMAGDFTALQADASARCDMSRLGRDLVDGAGVERVVANLCGHVNTTGVSSG